ncbi:MAG TPA: hypothetical protein VMI31_05135 [Fimbriimonadaceae bacterium]|nr:hypothetical protein [Fimbriimonadaceae bacterium]
MKRLFILLPIVLAAGCMPHFKDVDSYDSMFQTTVPPEKGDPFTFDGIAEGSGGTIARASYPTDNSTPDPLDATESGRLGELAKDRTPTPGDLPGEAGNLPGAGPTYPGFGDLPVTHATSTTEPAVINSGSQSAGAAMPSTKQPTPGTQPPTPKSGV